MHGGVAALILDQVLGEAAGAGGKPGMTGTLTLRYRQGTPLGDLRGEAWIDRVEGIKTFAKAHIIGRRRGHRRGRGRVHPAQVGARGDRSGRQRRPSDFE